MDKHTEELLRRLTPLKVKTFGAYTPPAKPTVLPEMHTMEWSDLEGGRCCSICMTSIDANGDCTNRGCQQSYEVRTQLRLTIAIEKLLEKLG